MPNARKNQKQIAQRYLENLRYFNKMHPLRRARMWLMLLIMILAGGGAWFYLSAMRSNPKLEILNNTGGISQSHSKIASDCKQCHDPALPISLHNLTSGTTSIDAKCQVCHTEHNFHQVNVVMDHSCTDCHHEHLGTGPMQAVKDTSCSSCHGNAETMASSAELGLKHPASDFMVDARENLLTYFQPVRPAKGYTRVFQSFEGDHPDFQIQREKLTDPDTLKFNHKLHLTGDIPMVDGKKLDCAYCHKPDSRGAYMQSLSFARNCQACHSLQIDPTLADFQIPHPVGGSSPNAVRDFLLTLPTQYASYATQKRGLTDPKQIAAFVNEKMTGIQERVRNGADLQKEVFFGDNKIINLAVVSPTGIKDRTLFPGCAYCHEVKASNLGEPVITKPVVMDRWYVHARFDHSAHTNMSCEECHNQIKKSELTSDINLPEKASCVTCHSAKGGVVSTCTTCHEYHNKAPAKGVASNSNLRDMLLAKP